MKFQVNLCGIIARRSTEIILTRRFQFDFLAKRVNARTCPLITVDILGEIPSNVRLNVCFQQPTRVT